ncbi:MAG: PKD domain-containing protein [Syntrophobacteraceae bacterium]
MKSLRSGLLPLSEFSIVHAFVGCARADRDTSGNTLRRDRRFRGKQHRAGPFRMNCFLLVLIVFLMLLASLSPPAFSQELTPLYYEMVTLKSIYNATGGAHWTNNEHWLTGDNPCQWHGVECFDFEKNLGLPEWQRGVHVSGLRLAGNNLKGVLPVKFDAPHGLNNLVVLDLSGNSGLSGPIPGWLFTRPSSASSNLMFEIHLNNTNLSGLIPASIGKAPYLQKLDLSFNHLGGSIPTTIGRLKNLRSLNLADNRLTGLIPTQIGKATSLKTLNLSNNLFNVGVPGELGFLVNLKELDMSRNQLKGEIPSSLCDMVALESLNLSQNQLNGAIPSCFEKLDSLKRLQISSNQLNRPLPVELGLMGNLSQLHLQGNLITGTLPAELGNAPALSILNLTHNRLTGHIPPELFSNVNLKTINLDDNRFTGSLDGSIANAVNLMHLDLRGNLLEGALPPEFGSLADLQTLYLSSNHFTGELPVELMDLSALSGFWFDNTALCEPASTAFQAWLDGLPSAKRTEICNGPYFSIYGRVSDQLNKPLVATMSTDATHRATSYFNNGSYALHGLHKGEYTVTPVKGITRFTPVNRTVTLGPDATLQNFKATEVVAAFTGAPRVGRAPLRVKFTDTSIGTITKWRWTFGDGQSSELENPTHKYITPGKYTVKLTVSGPKGKSTKTQTRYIKVSK